jgi:outer membrane immunogenic protein
MLREVKMKIRSGMFGLTLGGLLAFVGFSVNAGGYENPYGTAATWTGFYIGVNGGYGWTANTQPGDLQPSGGFAGGQIGYNMQFGGRWVLGVEADFQGAGISDKVDLGFVSAENSLNWFGTVRGRIGYAMDRTLVYFTGGFAFGEVESKGQLFGSPFDIHETQTGYVLGGGLEYKFSPAWSVKGEYEFISLDASNLSGPGPLSGGNTDRSEVHTIRFGVNYHFGQDYGPIK